MEDQELIRAIERLTDKLDSVASSVGRGAQSTGSTASKNGPVPRARAVDPAQKENRVELDKSTKAIKAQRVQTDAEIKSSKEAVDAQADLTKEQKAAQRQQEGTTRAFKNFGETLIGENANLSSAFGRLGSNLEYTGTAFGRVAGGIAAGIGYALGGLQEFAKQAGDMGAFADLSKFSVGSVTSMKLMSGLGGAFMKVIEDSQGGFKAFGATSQEAAENLSNLSRGLKYGSGYLNNTLRNALGKDLVKSVDRASNAAAAMGLGDEERARLLGSIAQSSSLAAKNEQDAQQRLVKQYGDTLDNTRKLSSAFGVSTKEILAAMADFRKTTAGTYAGLEGNTAAQNLVPLIKSMGIESDPEKISKIALALSRGELGQALPNVSNASAIPILEMLNQAVQNGGEGGNNTEAITKNLKGMTGEMKQLSQERSQYATTAADYAAPGAVLGTFAKRLETGGKDEGTEAPRTSEMDNIKSMNSLTAALESLRNVIIGVTAGIATLVGSLGAIAVFGAGGGLLAGGLGKVLGGITDKLGGAAGGVLDRVKDSKLGRVVTDRLSGAGRLVPDRLAGSAGSGVMDKLSGAAGKGMEGFGDLLAKLGESKTVKGAATLALLGSALALSAVGLKTFNEVEWTSLAKGTVALGGLIGMARLVGEATTGIVKGAAAIALLGAAVLVSAVGFKTFNEVNWDSLIKGTVAIGALAGAATLLGNITPSLLMGALGVAALGAAMWVAGKGFQSFNELKWESMAKGVVALGAFGVVAAAIGAFIAPILLGSVAIAGLGVALGVFGAGAYVAAQAADVFATAIKKVGDVDGVNLIAVGAGLAAVGAGAVVFAAGMVAATATSLVTGLMGLFGAKSPMERILELVPVADKISLIGEGMFKFGSSIGLINENLQSLDLDALDKFKNALIEISNIDMPSLDGLSIPQISTDGIVGAPQQNNAFANVLNGSSAVTPDVIAQLMSYLSSIENDLAAIRGNTRQTGYESPVRLA